MQPADRLESHARFVRFALDRVSRITADVEAMHRVDIAEQSFEAELQLAKLYNKLTDRAVKLLQAASEEDPASRSTEDVPF